jgi:DHA2 family multidrug resistance protein
MGAIMGVFGLANLVGPALGGYLTGQVNWRWVFYINLPVGAMSLFMIRTYVFDPPYLKKVAQSIDYWGMGMLVVGIGALQFVLDKGQTEDWFQSTMIVTLTIISVVALIALIYYELHTAAPIVDLSLFKNRTYATGVFLMTVVGFALYGGLVLLPLMLQTLFGYSSLEAGKAMAPRGIGSLIMMPMVGMLTSKVDPRKLLVVGLIVGGITMIWLGQINLNAGYWDIVWPQFLQGAGLALLFVPLTTVSMATIDPQRMGYATSLFNLMRNIGGSVGIAMTGTYLARHGKVVAATLGENISAYDPQTQSTLSQIIQGMVAAGADITTATQRGYAVLHGMLLKQASMVSFVEVYRLLGVLFLIMLPLVFIMQRPSKGAAPPAGAH